MLGVDSIWAQPLLLAHFGLFLIWQPLWRGEKTLNGGALAVIVFVAMMAMFWLNWWAIAFWLTGLFGLVGARVLIFRDRWARVLSLLVMVYLLAVLLLWVAPNLLWRTIYYWDRSVANALCVAGHVAGNALFTC